VEKTSSGSIQVGVITEMAPGQHHLRLNMFIARARASVFEIVKNLDAIDPKEQPVNAAAVA
jgi:branched-chain amino acid transport system substrate-binding protein